MARNLQLHKPFEIKSLSKPLGGVYRSGRYLAGDVFGQKQGCRKRKRAELSVAIDGDGIHLYDVGQPPPPSSLLSAANALQIPSSQEITSYLIPPQSFSTCVPYSMHWKSTTDTGSAIRYTYASIEDSSSSRREIKLFKDVLTDLCATNSSIISHECHYAQSVVHLSATTENASSTMQATLESDLVAVVGDGTVVGLHGETLEKLWESPPSLLVQELPLAQGAGLLVEYVQAGSSADVLDGLFGGNASFFGTLQEKKIERRGFNPDILILITSQNWASSKPRQRFLHILVVPPKSQAQQSHRQGPMPILVAPFPTSPTSSPVKYQMDIRSGTVQELSAETIYTYSLESGIPRLQSKLHIPEANSFLRLSRSSILVSTPSSISIYNPLYCSLQASTQFQDETREQSLDDGHFDLICYHASREIAVGLRGPSLVAVQIEAPKIRKLKRGAEGLLADSIRRGVYQEPSRTRPSTAHHPHRPLTISEVLPGSATATDWEQYLADTTKADELLKANDLYGFEVFMSHKLRVKLGETVAASTNGDEVASRGSSSNAYLPTWKWPSRCSNYTEVDRRWIFYTICRVFTLNSDAGGTSSLSCRLSESNLLNYLVSAGHLTISNLKSSFRDELRDVDLEAINKVLGEHVPQLLAETDPSMKLLIGYLSATKLGAMELVTAIRLIMRSLGLVEDRTKFQKMLTDAADGTETDNEVIGMELERAEEELELAESYLGSELDARDRGLSIAFRKLVVCPAALTVKTLRRLLRPEETLCLIDLLRKELIRNGWITRYLDMSDNDEDDKDDGSIQIIADLLCRCIDSVGVGGWLAQDAMMANWGNKQDSADYFKQFQAEVSVALEGVEEAIHLQGSLGEIVNYVSKTQGVPNADPSRPHKQPTMIKISQSAHLQGPLPIGLKPPAMISSHKMDKGVMVPRSSREISFLLDKHQGPYSVHRINEGVLRSGWRRAWKKR